MRRTLLLLFGFVFLALAQDDDPYSWPQLFAPTKFPHIKITTKNFSWPGTGVGTLEIEGSGESVTADIQERGSGDNPAYAPNKRKFKVLFSSDPTTRPIFRNVGGLSFEIGDGDIEHPTFICPPSPSPPPSPIENDEMTAADRPVQEGESRSPRQSWNNETRRAPENPNSGPKPHPELTCLPEDAMWVEGQGDSGIIGECLGWILHGMAHKRAGLGLPMAMGTFAKVTVDGNYLGLYCMQEQQDHVLPARGLTNDGQAWVYKVHNAPRLREGPTATSPTTDALSFKPFASGKAPPDYHDVIYRLIDTEQLSWFAAVNLYIAAGDGVYEMFYYDWDHPDLKRKYAPDDLDDTFRSTSWAPGRSHFLYAMYNTMPEIKAAIKEGISDGGVFSVAALQPYLVQINDEIKEAIEGDEMEFFYGWKKPLDALYWIMQRNRALEAALN